MKGNFKPNELNLMSSLTLSLPRATLASANDLIAHGVGPSTTLSVFSTATKVKACSVDTKHATVRLCYLFKISEQKKSI